MAQGQDRVRPAPRVRFAGGEHLFDLAAESQKLEAEPHDARHGHRQITLFRRGGVSIVLFDFEADGWLTDHAADGYVSVQVLSGELRMTTDAGTHAMRSGSLLVLAPNLRHDVRALAPSRMLLTVFLERPHDDRVT